MQKPFFYDYISQICELSGYLHDIGKCNSLFQNKIRGGDDLVDIVRHEFLSFYITLKLIESYKDGEKFISEEKFKSIFKELNSTDSNIVNYLTKTFDINNNYYKFKINNDSNLLLNCILFCIVSHHVIPSSKNPEDSLIDNTIIFNNTNRIYSLNLTEKKEIKKLKDNVSLFNDFYISSDLEDKINCSFFKTLSLSKTIPIESNTSKEHYFKSFSIISRIILILSDHYSSSQKLSKLKIDRKESYYKNVYANTNRNFMNNDENIEPTFNQTLDEHLTMVGDNSTQFLNEITNIDTLPVLSESTIQNILENSTNPSFFWQNEASTFIENNAVKNQSNLILNLGTTGSGKTRMNVKALASINKKLRITSVFNLKSLTLQTGAAYKKQLLLQENEIDTIIGDTNYLEKMKDEEIETAHDNDSILEIAPALTLNTYNQSTQLPYLSKTVKDMSFIEVPTLVSTIDFCIAAGDISKGTNHIQAFLRIMSSDLVIDEIDSYEPEMFESVLRLISIASMLNRNIVISSATLSKPYFKMIKLAFNHGNQLKSHLNNQYYNDNIFFISNIIEPELYSEKDNFNTYVGKMCSKFTENKEKLAKILSIDLNKKQVIPPLLSSIKELHINNNQKYENKYFSYGLIRFGKINDIVNFAKKLEILNFSKEFLTINGQKETMQLKFITYHSRLRNDKRFDIEKFLDEALNRNSDKIPDLIKQTLDSSEATHTIFLVLASPVEEIGRDHDFDWAIIEPSSIQSIIQTSGRVNRHRKTIPQNPNIYILQYNLSYYKKPIKDYSHFSKPGLEIKNNYYPQDITNLLPLNNNTIYITSKLRYDSKFALYDDKSINLTFGDKYKYSELSNNYWIKTEYYNQYKLRNKIGNTLEFTIEEHNFYQTEDNLKKSPKQIEHYYDNNILKITYPISDSHSQSLKDWMKLCSINIYKDNDKNDITYHPYFGMYLNK